MNNATPSQTTQRPRLHVVREAPDRIECPTWCETTAEQHRDELADPLLGGEVQHVHRFQLTPDGSPDDLWLCCTTRPDSTAYDGGVPTPELHLCLDLGLSLDDAEQVASGILAAVALARGADGRDG